MFVAFLYAFVGCRINRLSLNTDECSWTQAKYENLARKLQTISIKAGSSLNNKAIENEV